MANENIFTTSSADMRLGPRITIKFGKTLVKMTNFSTQIYASKTY